MSFWEDSSPIVKVALIVGVLGLIYLGLAYFIGWVPFPPKCEHEQGGQTVSGCAEGAQCIDGDCVQQHRGLQHR
jgi:hypothetical protein